MKNFPMFLNMRGRRVVIAGGGEQAAQKARLILKTEARIEVLADKLDPELQALARSGRVKHIAGPVTSAHFADTALVFIATGHAGEDERLHGVARSVGALVNVVDRPELCEASTPSIVDRDPVVVAIGTEGTAPVLARRIKTEVETMLDPRLGAFAALAGRLRDTVAEKVPATRRRAFWRWAFDGPWKRFRSGAERDAARQLKAAIAGADFAQDPKGRIALVGAGPGARDLLTLRAVERLQEADVIFYDRLVDTEVLELARRDAERVYVGKTVGTTDWPQERISALIVAEARRGRSVVRLKSGDPSIFGRAGEELEAARSAGIEVEIVPGVTAASAAAAALGEPLTERGQIDAVILATGMCRPGDSVPDLGHMARPGTSLALYMGLSSAARIETSLLQAGVPAATPVRIVASASTGQQKILSAPLEKLADTVRQSEVKSPAILLVSHPKSQGQAAPNSLAG